MAIVFSAWAAKAAIFPWRSVISSAVTSPRWRLKKCSPAYPEAAQSFQARCLSPAPFEMLIDHGLDAVDDEADDVAVSPESSHSLQDGCQRQAGTAGVDDEDDRRICRCGSIHRRWPPNPCRRRRSSPWPLPKWLHQPQHHGTAASPGQLRRPARGGRGERGPDYTTAYPGPGGGTWGRYNQDRS